MPSSQDMCHLAVQDPADTAIPGSPTVTNPSSAGHEDDPSTSPSSSTPSLTSDDSPSRSRSSSVVSFGGYSDEDEIIWPTSTLAPEPSNQDSDFSDIEGTYDDPNNGTMIGPKQAKKQSKKSDCFYAVTSRNPNSLVPGDELECDGMTLQGYHRGKPVYFYTGGLYRNVGSKLTTTAYGTRYVDQPIETCFGRTSAVEDLGEILSQTKFLRDGNDAPEEDPLPLNRTFTNNWLKVAKSDLGGFGVFATTDIPAYTSILLEKPFLKIQNRNDEKAKLLRKYKKLGAEEKAVYDGLHGFSSRTTQDEVLMKFDANCFRVLQGSAVLAIATNFNHACHMVRNVQYAWDVYRKAMVFTTDRAIAEGEELLVAYGNNHLDLRKNYGFNCECGAPGSLSTRTVEAMLKAERRWI